MSNTLNYIRLNISLPEDLVAILKASVPSRGMSAFLAEAAREKIILSEKENALNELLDAVPTFTKIKDSVNYVRKIRKTDEKRTGSFKI